MGVSWIVKSDNTDDNLYERYVQAGDHREKRSWPNDEYEKRPSMDVKFIRSADVLPDEVNEAATVPVNLSPSEMLEIADAIRGSLKEEKLDKNVSTRNLGRYHEAANWLEYWAERGCYIS